MLLLSGFANLNPWQSPLPPSLPPSLNLFGPGVEGLAHDDDVGFVQRRFLHDPELGRHHRQQLQYTTRTRGGRRPERGGGGGVMPGQRRKKTYFVGNQPCGG